MAKSWIDHYKELRAAWVARRGIGGTSTSTGAHLPKMIASDSLALLGPFSGAVLRFIDARQLTSGNHPGRQWSPDSAMQIGAGAITPTEWLMRGVPKAGEPFVRSVRFGVAVNGLPISPIIDTRGLLGRGSIGTEAARQLVGQWQSAINVAADHMRGAGGLTRALTATEVEAFWSRLYATVIALDTAGEAPMESDWTMAADLAKSTAYQAKETVKDAAEIAGKVAAEIAQTAGEAVGSAASGFFSQAGLTALVVTGGALYIALS